MEIKSWKDKNFWVPRLEGVALSGKNLTQNVESVKVLAAWTKLTYMYRSACVRTLTRRPKGNFTTISRWTLTAEQTKCLS